MQAAGATRSFIFWHFSEKNEGNRADSVRDLIKICIVMNREYYSSLN